MKMRALVASLNGRRRTFRRGATQAMPLPSQCGGGGGPGRRGSTTAVPHTPAAVPRGGMQRDSGYPVADTAQAMTSECRAVRADTDSRLGF